MRFGAPAGLDVAALAARLGAPVEVARRRRVPRARRRARRRWSPRLTAWLAEHDLPLADLRAGRQRLEDVFLRLVGRRREDRRVKPLAAHLRLELALLARNGESLLLTLGIPVVLLVFFTNVDVLPDRRRPDRLPRARACSRWPILSTAFVNLAIGVGFEREYGVLKRLGATPLGRPRLLGAKTLAVVVVEAVQVAVLWPLALALGWDPSPELGVRRSPSCSARSPSPASACAWPARCGRSSTLAAANGLYLVLLLLSGMVIPLDELPDARCAPSPGSCPAPRSPRWCAAPLTGGDRRGPARGPCSPPGPSPPRSSPPASSAGSSDCAPADRRGRRSPRGGALLELVRCDAGPTREDLASDERSAAAPCPGRRVAVAGPRKKMHVMSTTGSCRRRAS